MPSQAQGIFNQNGSQKKLQIQQIAALRAYTGYLEKGYGLVKDGTKVIGDFKNGEFNLHKNYFDSLKKVRPDIRSSGKVDEIRAMEEAIRQLRPKALQEAANSLFFSSEELAMLRQILNGLGDEAAKDIEELELVIRDGMLALGDEGRLKRISDLYERMSGRYATQRQWNKAIHQLVVGRQRTDKDLQLLKQLYGG